MATIDLQEIGSVASPDRDNIKKQVVSDANASRFLTTVLVVPAQEINTGGCMAHDVICYLDILNDAPGCFAVLIARSNDQGGSANLTFNQVTIHHYAPRILQFESSLDSCPVRPLRGPVQIIAPNLDVRRNKVRNRWIGASKHDDFGPGLKKVIDYVKGTGAVPTCYGLGFVARARKSRNVRIENRSFSAVKSKTTTGFVHTSRMNVATIKDQMIRKLRIGIILRASEVNEVVNVVRIRRRRKLDANKSVMVRLRLRANRRLLVWRHYLRHESRMKLGLNALAVLCNTG